MFDCDMCGECCRNIGGNELLAELDSGNGVCKYLNGNKCSIYQERPMLCRVDDFYDMYLSDKMSRDDYYRQNHKACEILKNRRK